MKENSTIKTQLYQNNVEWNRLMNELATCAPFRVNIIITELDRINQERYELILKEKGDQNGTRKEG